MKTTLPAESAPIFTKGAYGPEIADVMNGYDPADEPDGPANDTQEAAQCDANT